jgi:Na+-transporting NADH:ubiquinone oxidoreductase subunit C
MSPDKESMRHTLIVATALCLVCSVLVSAAAVVLRPVQLENQTLDRKRNILDAAGLLEEDADIDQLFTQITPALIDLDSGELVEAPDPAGFDQYKAAKEPELSRALGPDEDLASIRRRPNLANVYLVNAKDGELEQVVLPVHGYGLWSTMYGFLALDADGQTIRGLTFYQHGETPGLGGEISNPDWLALWRDRQVFDDSGTVAISLVKGGPQEGSPAAVHQVDALAGATLTSDGVENLMRFWLGELGFGPFLSKLRMEANNG